MKFFRIIILLFLLSAAAGCRSYYTLRRTPQRRTIQSRRQPQTRQQHNQPQRRKSDTDLFDVIFHRNPQDSSESSHLSDAEREILRRSDISQDPAVREIHNRDSRSQEKNSDWVFGTRNGSYF